jgi:hypothetical protein
MSKAIYVRDLLGCEMLHARWVVAVAEAYFPPGEGWSNITRREFDTLHKHADKQIRAGRHFEYARIYEADGWVSFPAGYAATLRE